MAYQYTAEEVSKSLVTMVALAGNAAATARALADEGITVPETTLRYWRNQMHADRYRELELEHRPAIDAQAVSQARLLVDKLGRAEELAVDRATQGLERGEFNPDEAATILHNLKTGEISEEQALTQLQDDAYIPVAAKDAALIAKNLTLSKGINIDKIDVREGKATQRVEITAGDDLLRALEAQGLIAPPTVDSEAELVEPAQLTSP